MTKTSTFENNWTYASKLLDHLENSGFFKKQTDNDGKIEVLRKELARWSKVNYEIYGCYQLHEDQLNQILEGIAPNQTHSSNETIQELIDMDLLHFEVTENGELSYRIPVKMVN